jgi:hypothetical protein
MALGRPRSPKQTGFIRPVPIRAGALIGTVTDDFDDNSVDGSKFYTWANTGATAAETTQKIVVTVDNSSADVYGGIDLQPRLSLFGSQISVKIDTYPTQSANTQIYLLLQEPGYSNNRILMQSVGGTWSARYRDNTGTDTVVGTYVGTPAYIKISESAGVVHYWWSNDGISWTEIGTGVTLNRSWMGQVFTELAFGHFASDIASNTAKFDNLNIVPGAVSATGLAVPITFGSAVVLEKIVGTGLAVPVVFGSPVVTENIAGTGLAVPVAFGTPTLKSNVVGSGLAVPVTFGSPTLVAGGAGSITATGLAVPVAFGSATLSVGGGSAITAVGLAVSVTFGTPTVSVKAVATGLAVPVSFGSPMVGTNRKVGTVSDDFNDNSIDATKWFKGTTTGATVTETTQQVVVTVDNSIPAAYGLINVVNERGELRLDLRESECFIKISQYPTLSAGVHLYMLFQQPGDSTHRVALQYVGSEGRWTAFYRDGAAPVEVGSYYAQPPWLKISNSGGVFRWWWSNDSLTWTEIGSGLAFDQQWMQAATVQVAAGHYISDIASNTTKFDNLNLVQAAVVATGLAVPVSFGSPTVTEKVVATGLAVPVAFGAPTLRRYFAIVATGLAVPVTFGAGTTVQFRLYVILVVDFEQGVQLVDFESGVGAVGNLEAGLVTVDSA